MAVDERTLPAFLNDDASYRAWASGIDAQLLAAGMVAVPQSSDINFATVARPTSTFGIGGTRVYRFNDAQQATFPIFLLLGFGVGSPTDRPYLTFRFGSGANGAGVLTGQVSQTFSISAASSKTAGAVLPSYCSVSDSGLRLCTNLDRDVVSNQPSMLLYAERNRDAANAVDDEGLWFGWAAQNGSSGLVVPRTGSVPTSQFSGAHPFPMSMANCITSWSNDVSLIPGIVAIGRPWILRSLVVYRHTDLSELVPFQADHMGAQRTFLPLGDGGPPLGTTGTSGFPLAMLWE